MHAHAAIRAAEHVRHTAARARVPSDEPRHTSGTAPSSLRRVSRRVTPPGSRRYACLLSKGSIQVAPQRYGHPCNVNLGSDLAIASQHSRPRSKRMKVTVDTRHDSLEEALATVRAAFGSNGTLPNGAEHATRRARSAGSPTATTKVPGSPAGRATTVRKASGRNGRKPTARMNPTSNIAPRGQADAIRAWAKAHGMQVKQAGRLPAAVIQAYRESSHS